MNIQPNDVLIDDDEILPEIDIRELLTIEQLQEFNNNFVAFTDNDIYIMMNDLLQNTNLSMNYINLYKSVLNKPEFSIYKYNIIPKIYGFRKDYEEDKGSESDGESDGSEDSDEEPSEIKKYFRDYENALTARNYSLQQILINKISFPFRILNIMEEERKPFQFTITEPGEIILEYDDILDISRITIADINYFDKILISALIFKQPKFTIHSYLYETYKQKALNINKLIDIDNIDNIADIKKTIIEKVIPKFDSVIKTINRRLNLRELSLLLSINAYNLDELSKEQFEKLQEHLSSIIQSEESDSNNSDKDSDSHGNDRFKVIKIRNKYNNFIDILKPHFTKFDILTDQDNILIILQIISSFLNSIEPSAIVLENEVSTIHILNELKNSGNYDEVINKVKTFLIQKNANKAMEFMDNYKKLKKPDDIDSIIEKYKLIGQKYIDYTEYLNININSDLKNIILGTNTKNYDGAPNKDADEIYAEDAEYVIPMDETDIELDISDVLTSIESNIEFNISDFDEYAEGVKDILIKIIPFFLKISYISGLPFNKKAISERISKTIIFESRKMQILKELPDISDIIINSVCQNTFEESLVYIHEITNVDILTKLQDIFPSIYQSWDKECKKAIIEGMTLWWLDLLESSLRGVLKFSIFDGYLQYAPLWSKFGPPLQPKSSSGILIYLVNVSLIILETELKIDNDKEFRKIIEYCANEKYKDKLTELDYLWKKIKDDEIVEDNVEKAKMSLIETIKQLQQKKRPKNYIPSFVNAFLYLPMLIPQKHIKNANWAQGCCLAELNESYESDADWRTFSSLAGLNAIKKDLSLSKNKFIKQRSNYYYYSKPTNITDKVSFEKIDCIQTTTKIEDEEAVAEKLKSLSELTFTWLPKIIKNDSKKMKDITTNIIKNIFTVKNSNIILNIFDNITSINHSLSILILIITTLQKNSDNDFIKDILIYCKEMKTYMNMLSQDDINQSKYIIAKALCFPGNYNPVSSKIILPSGIAENLYPDIKKEHLKNIIEWDKSRKIMNDEEIKEYLNTMREKQKDIILDNLNAIEDNAEKQLLSEMKNFGLISYTDIYKKSNDEEPVVEEAYLDEDLEGELDFAQKPTDSDDINDDMID